MARKLVKVKNLIKLDQAVMKFKIESLWDKFRQRCHNSNCNTRNCRNLEIPKTNLEKTKKGFHQTGIRVWNNVPNEVREPPLIHQFENNTFNRFKKHIFLFYFKNTAPWKNNIYAICIYFKFIYYVYNSELNFLYFCLAEGIACIKNW